jgi:hypothetical protein
VDEARAPTDRLDARALLALGWLPSPDEPCRVYPLQADMPSAVISEKAWQDMHDIMAERRT